MPKRLQAVALALIVLALAGGQASASIWDRLASFVPGMSRTSTEALEDVARHVAALPADAAYTAIAAAATEVGHWRLVNRAGEPFTASGPNELAQALRTLAPEAEGRPDRLRIYLTPATVFRYPAAIADLPIQAALSVLIEGRALALQRTGNGSTDRLRLMAGPRLAIEASDRALFDEIAWQLRRPLDKPAVRTLSIEPGGPALLRRTPEIDPATRRARPDAIDPGQLARALGSLQGQIVLLAGRPDGTRLVYRPAAGAEGGFDLGDLWAYATRAETNLIAMATSSARQPGSRNWLWQRIELGNVEKALQAIDLGGLLLALAGDGRSLIVTGRWGGADRVELEIRPQRQAGLVPAGPVADAVSGTWSDIVAETAGALTVSAMRASMTSATRQAELDRRLVPLVPSVLQWGYLGLVVLGLVGLPTLRAWWRRIWPHESPADYGNWIAHRLAGGVRGLMFGLFFMPLASLPALAVRLTGWRTRTSRVAVGEGNAAPG